MQKAKSQDFAKVLAMVMEARGAMAGVVINSQAGKGNRTMANMIQQPLRMTN